MEDSIFIGRTQPENNYDALGDSDNSGGEDCLENVNMEFNQGNRTEIPFWGNFRKFWLGPLYHDKRCIDIL